MKRDPRTGVVKINCPGCGYKLDAATSSSADDSNPRPGDFSICINCLCFLEFEGGGHLHKLGAVEFLALNKDTQDTLIRARSVLASARRSTSLPV